ncbi:MULTISPECIES: hypothetical protein [Cohnella]|uniref:hypothetical protein n=1 Tax=Cohnella TaxID=329857 RepID=UPI0009B99DFF|nr:MULTISPECIES: hypothetical protein [Cohnella]MBN2980230.1 hypothetical protein [Cohnella algarum]
MTFLEQPFTVTALSGDNCAAPEPQTLKASELGEPNEGELVGAAEQPNRKKQGRKATKICAAPMFLSGRIW